MSEESITLEVKVRLQAIALLEEGGGYSVVVPALHGCYTQGDTIEEARANVVEAADGWLAATHDQRREQAIRIAQGEAEESTPRRAALQKLVEKYPAPPEWYDEPEQAERRALNEG
jgi:antitoxin HicB